VSDIEIVDEGVIEFRYSIRKGPLDDSGEFWFDWIASNGDESDETFDSEEEATADVTRRYS
jgi:hypothetical protein